MYCQGLWSGPPNIILFHVDLHKRREREREECVCVFSHIQLRDPMDHSPPDSSVHGILQARILEWVAMPPSRGCSQPRDRTLVSCIVGLFFIAEPPGKPHTREEGTIICWSLLLLKVFLQPGWYPVTASDPSGGHLDLGDLRLLWS